MHFYASASLISTTRKLLENVTHNLKEQKTIWKEKEVWSPPEEQKEEGSDNEKAKETDVQEEGIVEAIEEAISKEALVKEVDNDDEPKEVRITDQEENKQIDLLDEPEPKEYDDQEQWVLRNTLNEQGNMVRNNTRLVCQGYTHVEGIIYDEIFAHTESIRMLFAYASYMKYFKFCKWMLKWIFQMTL